MTERHDRATSEQPATEMDLLRIDTESRARAIDVSRSCIVRAPAGSGKTALLIQRVLALLATVDAPEEIVAITFTRKAAAEMRVRILQALADAEEGLPVEGHRERTRSLATAVLERDTELQWQLREQPSRLHIMTIDALNGWIVRQMPWISGMGATPSIADDAGELYTEAVAEVLLREQRDTQLREHMRNLLYHLDNRFLLVRDLLLRMLAIRDQWITLIESGGGLSDAAREVIERSLHDIVTTQLHRLRDAVAEDEYTELCRLGRHAAETLSAAEEDASVLHAFSEYSDVPTEPDAALRFWQAAATFLLTKSGTLRSPKGVNRRLGFPPGDAMKADMVSLLERLQDSGEFTSLLARVETFPALRYTARQWDLLAAILAVLRACVDALRTVFARKGTVDHVEVAAAAQRALGSELEPTDLSLMLEYRIRHLLVDEFQDTSAGQFRLLRLLTAGWMPDDGHTLFLVGDPMQSIYRFREAEVGLFLRIWEEKRLASVPLLPLRLTRNFRSQARLVEWVNRAFAPLMPAHNDPETGAVSFEPSEATRSASEEGFAFHPVEGRDREEETRVLIGHLRFLGHGSDDGSEPAGTAVLVRSRLHLAELLPALRSAGIPFQAVEIESLSTHPAVMDLRALTRALLHPGDRSAWLAVLHAPFCGLQLEDLRHLCENDPDASLIDLLRNTQLVEGCTDDGRVRIARVLPLLAGFAADAGRRPLRRLVEGCWIALGGPACVDGEGYEAAMTYLAMLGEVSEGGRVRDPVALDRSLARLYAPSDPGASHALQLMTIHKSKGLQFDHVLLPRLDAVPRHGDEQLLLWLENAGPRQDAFLLAPLRERGGEQDATYRYISTVLTAKEDQEQLRVLYVAVTRARQSVFATGGVQFDSDDADAELKPPRRRSFLNALWPLLAGDAATGLRNRLEGPRIEAEGNVRQQLRRLRSDWEMPSPPPDVAFAAERAQVAASQREQAVLPWKAGAEARATGIALHSILAQIGERGLSWWEGMSGSQQQSLLAQVLGLREKDAVTSAVLQRTLTAVRNMTADTKGRWVLGEHRGSRNEWRVSGVDDERVRSVVVDRSFVDEEGTRWVIEYKSAEHEGGDLEAFIAAELRAHGEQLRRYMRLIGAMEGTAVRGALYFPQSAIFRELTVEDQGALPPSM